MAAVHSPDRDKAGRALVHPGEEFPEMDESQLCTWLIEKWR